MIDAAGLFNYVLYGALTVILLWIGATLICSSLSYCFKSMARDYYIQRSLYDKDKYEGVEQMLSQIQEAMNDLRGKEGRD